MKTIQEIINFIGQNTQQIKSRSTYPLPHNLALREILIDKTELDIYEKILKFIYNN